MLVHHLLLLRHLQLLSILPLFCSEKAAHIWSASIDEYAWMEEVPALLEDMSPCLPLSPFIANLLRPSAPDLLPSVKSFELLPPSVEKVL